MLFLKRNTWGYYKTWQIQSGENGSKVLYTVKIYIKVHFTEYAVHQHISDVQLNFCITGNE